MAVPIITQEDGVTTEQWDTDAQVYTRWMNDVIDVQRPFTDAETAWVAATEQEQLQAANSDVLTAQAGTEMAVNQAYLDHVAAGTATQTMVVAQVATLTRQLMGFGRLLVGGELLNTTDTQ